MVEHLPNRSQALGPISITHTQISLTIKVNYSIPNIGKSPVFEMNLGSVESAGSEVGLQEELQLWSEAQAPGQWTVTQTLDQPGSDLVILTTLLASSGSAFLVAQSKTFGCRLCPLPGTWQSKHVLAITLPPLLTLRHFMPCLPVLVKENSSTQQMPSSPVLNNAETHYLE